MAHRPFQEPGCDKGFHYDLVALHDGITGNAVFHDDPDRLRLVIIRIAVIDRQHFGCRVGAFQFHFHDMVPLVLETPCEYAAHGRIRLALGANGELPLERAVFCQGGGAENTDIMVLRGRDGRRHQVGPFGQPQQVFLLLLRARPELPDKRHPGRVEQQVFSIG